ncbi:iron-containing alcohol dehydrogenase [Siculibacillus lacustris]|uniref:Iron-containing alcohol dehydrogenase n=1 Tax=Siculibacillus lacustris TaxID=1549641 RepID=A0A4Q9VWW3_9HYPH|nr:iron-containing alcohol dehydrogenase [Siculibacillus lacustris]TBW40858.1 iron-containing alcohol dehydrogenase [Siculibacillus lacustris]
MADLTTPIEILHPPILKFGPGTVAEIGAFAAKRGFGRTLVVADAFNGARVDLLALPGAVVVFDRVTAEPTITDLAAALAVAADFAPDLVVGFGGGSAMDLAKLVAVLWTGEQTLHEVVGPDRVAPRRTALAQVATTAGTGSEMGIRALVTDPETAAKLAVQSAEMLADLAVVDPDLTLTVPARITAETGVDALAHCAEAYTNIKAHPLIDVYALSGIRLIGRFLPRAVADGADREARAGLALASLQGGICLGPVNTHAGHAVAYPLGTRHHMPHGAANAVIFPHVLAYNAPARPERTAEILAALGLEPSSDPQTVYERAWGWCRSLGIEMRLSARGLGEGDLAPMATDAAAIRRLLDNNPRPIGEAEILAIYRAAF